jgi:FeS assembly SUF system regulator
MLRLGKLTDYATLLLTEMAADAARQRSASDLAAATRLPPTTVSKLLKQLSRAGIVASTRGAQGGFLLARTPSAISVADIVAALEGPIGITECAAHDSTCAVESHCGTRANWQLINRAIKSALEAVTLAQMASTMADKPPRMTESPLRFQRLPLQGQ